MAFPATTPGVESTFENFTGTAKSRSPGGQGIARDNFKGRQTGYFNLVYRALGDAAKAAFFTDYDTDPGAFSFTSWDASTHTVIYYGQPQAEWRADSAGWDVIVKLAKVPELGGDVLLESGDVLLLESGDDILMEA